MVGNRPGLADQLVETLAGHDPLAGGVTKDAARVYSAGVPQLNQWGLTGD